MTLGSSEIGSSSMRLMFFKLYECESRIPTSNSLALSQKVRERPRVLNSSVRIEVRH